MTEDDQDRSGYYQSIARAFLERRGAPFLLSPRDQALIAAWEAKKIPLRAVLEGIGRAFDVLRSRGRETRGISLGRCERQVEEAFAQHRDRGAGGRHAAETRPGKAGRARREIDKALRGLSPGDGKIAGLLGEALAVLEAPEPDEAALERIDAEIEELLWTAATADAKAAAEAAARGEVRGRPPAGLADAVRRSVVKEARAGRRVPHVSLFYY